MLICVFIQTHKNWRMILMMSSLYHPLCKTSPLTTHPWMVSPQTSRSTLTWMDMCETHLLFGAWVNGSTWSSFWCDSLQRICQSFCEKSTLFFFYILCSPPSSSCLGLSLTSHWLLPPAVGSCLSDKHVCSSYTGATFFYMVKKTTIFCT